MKDMQAIDIGGRDILAIGLQDCGNDPNPGVGKGGLELYDITDPSAQEGHCCTVLSHSVCPLSTNRLGVFVIDH